MQPLLGPVCSVPVLPDCCLKFPNSVFGYSELDGYLARDFDGCR
jgi:hypothetical protein